MGGLLSSNCSVSPLCDYNKIWIVYTDGNSFSGLADAPVPVPNTTDVLWFRGRANLDATLDAVARNVMGAPSPFANARHIVETGCSAGGLATYLHADYLHEKLTGAYTGTFASMPISGYFLDHANTEGEHVYGNQIAVIHALSNASTNAACEAFYAATPGDAYKCNMAEYVYPFITVPIFVLNSFYDSWQTGCIMTAEPVVSNPRANGNCSAAPGYATCARDLATGCTPQQINDVVDPYGEYMLNSLSVVNAAKSQAPGSGGFLTSCHTHCEAQGSYFDAFAVDGTTMGDAARTWLTAVQAGGAAAPAAQWTIDCTLPVATSPHRCNPTCGSAVSATAALPW